MCGFFYAFELFIHEWVWEVSHNIYNKLEKKIPA